MDLSAIQLPVQEDELEIHSSTLVNSLEIVPLDDSIEMPPPIDTQQILQFNQVIIAATLSVKCLIIENSWVFSWLKWASVSRYIHLKIKALKSFSFDAIDIWFFSSKYCKLFEIGHKP